ncbi:hypothetical protein SOPP22_08965 [Shewanella sp. OPT22]|nr:hypothetical protein SOPP22_08965 [Shewanella sp. OPT22]
MNEVVMAKINSVNAEINQIITGLAASRDNDFNKAEDLASSLLDQIDKRQKLLNELNKESDTEELGGFLTQQKALGQNFIDRLTEHRKFYYDAITKMKASSQKVGLYQSVNKSR